MNNYKKLIPEYLNFTRNIINSKNLPLNISKKILQQNKILKIIKKNLIKKYIKLIENLTKNKNNYKKFYKQFTKNLKII